MKFLLSEKYLLALFCLFFAMSSAFLFWQNERELDPNQGKNWWTLAFVAPTTTNSLDFVVENHGPQATFQYQITADKKMYVEGMFELKTGETRIVTPEINVLTDARTVISVTRDQEKKEIYR